MRGDALLLVGLTAALAACGTMRSPDLRPREAAPLIARTRVAAPADVPAPPADDAGSLACLDHPRIDGWEDRLRDSWSTTVLLERGAAYVSVIRPILVEQGAPPDLAVLPAVESSFRPEAVSRRGARGLWQLIPGTARDFGLVVRRGRDDRVHVERSTRAAAAFLAQLHERYGEWPLALAAYLAGPGRVDQALERAGGDATFWDLVDGGHLPAECTDYVPRVLAMARIAADGCRRPGRPGMVLADHDRRR